jgi:hypothetical protein
MRKAIIPVTCAVLLATAAQAQQPPQPSAAALPGSAAGQSDISGVVKQFALTPAGDIEGLVLGNGTEVHVAPHLTTEVSAAVQPGESVAVRGWSVGVPGFVVATALTGQGGRSVIDQGPPAPGMGPPPPRLQAGEREVTMEGRVQQLLHGPRGDINGAMLDNGTTVKIPPHAWMQIASLLQPGQTLTVQGWLLSNTYGRVVDVQAIGPNAGQLMDIGPPDGPGRPARPRPMASGALPTPSSLSPPPPAPAVGGGSAQSFPPQAPPAPAPAIQR